MTISFARSGFLSTEDDESPGNYGLLDQVRALEWVRDNVRYFGGMNDSVTVMGSGAGGVSAHLLMLTPLTRGASVYYDHSGKVILYNRHPVVESAPASRETAYRK